jgi:hypothetical protein
MAKFFRGLAQTGAWASLDEFNRCDAEVLSVVAQQLRALQAALRAGHERVLFEGREMRLVPSVGVFVTMNPGYTGRTELPDNLKVRGRAPERARCQAVRGRRIPRARGHKRAAGLLRVPRLLTTLPPSPARHPSPLPRRCFAPSP